MIKNVLKHKSCVRLQYADTVGDNTVNSITLPMLRASSLLITSGATLAEQQVHWIRSFEDIWKRVGVGAEALEVIILDAEWYLDVQVRINPDKLLKALGFPAGDYVIRRSTPADRLLVQLLPNRVLKNQHIQQLCQQLLYVQEEFSEVRFDIIEQAAATAFTSMYPSTSAAYLETKPDALQPIEPPAVPEPAVPAVPTPHNPLESESATPTDDPDINLPASTNTDPKAWLGKRRKQSDYTAATLESLGYTRGRTGYVGKEPKQLVDYEPHDALGFALNSEDEIEVKS